MSLLKNARTIALLCALAAMAPQALAQGGAKIALEPLDNLSNKAAETVDVSLDEQMLQVAERFLRSDRPDEATIKQLIRGLKGVYVKVFEFEQAGEYLPADLGAIRSQLQSPGWSRIVGVRSRRQGEQVEVYTWLEGGQVAGLAIIAAEPKELVVVNIVGPIDLEKLSQLEGKFGIPRLDLDRTGPPRRK